MKSKKLSVAVAIAAGAMLPFASLADDTNKNRASAGSSVQERSTGPSMPGSSSAGASTSAGGPAAGASATPGASARMDFGQLDANNDGMIDQTEANKSTQLRSQFRSMDKDGDGKISRTEWSGHFAQSGGSSAAGGSSAPGSTAGSRSSGTEGTRR